MCMKNLIALSLRLVGKTVSGPNAQRTVNGIVTCPLAGRLGNLKNDLDENRCKKKVRREKSRTQNCTLRR